jgi:hypothetical protein
MTPSQIETAARRRLNAVNDTFWASEEIIEDCLYFAMLDMVRETRVIEAVTTTVTVSGTAAYASPTYATEIKRITVAGKVLRLEDFSKIDAMRGNTTTTPSGTPHSFYLWDDSYYLFPTPSSSGDTISIWSFSEPARPSSSSTLEIPTTYHDSLVIGTIYYMVLKEPSDPRIPLFKKQWDEQVAKVRSHVQRKKRTAGFNRVSSEEQLFNVY